MFVDGPDPPKSPRRHLCQFGSFIRAKWASRTLPGRYSANAVTRFLVNWAEFGLRPSYHCRDSSYLASLLASDAIREPRDSAVMTLLKVNRLPPTTSLITAALSDEDLRMRGGGSSNRSKTQARMRRSRRRRRRLAGAWGHGRVSIVQEKQEAGMISGLASSMAYQ
jgi:hypothetical protein